MVSPSGNVWALTYDVNEFTNSDDAFVWYYDTDVVTAFANHNDGAQYGKHSGCWVRYSIGATDTNIPGLKMAMNCENKVMIMSVLGFGTSDEFIQLVVTVQGFFANSFRW
jgi:hypothetical protein